MFIKGILSSNITMRVFPIWRNNTRSFSFEKLKEGYRSFLHIYKPPVPPYKHICQIGDPILRTEAMVIEDATIQTPEFQKALQNLKNVMTHYGSHGLSAPQIGLPWQVFAIEVTEKSLKNVDPKILEIREVEVVPLKFFINPTLKIKDYAQIRFPEMCESVHGYSAIVPRAKEVEITAIDLSGQSFTWSAKGWTARLIQHEYDHLHGKMYTDRMDVSTFCCRFWETINKRSGNVALPFCPKS